MWNSVVELTCIYEMISVACTMLQSLSWQKKRTKFIGIGWERTAFNSPNPWDACVIDKYWIMITEIFVADKRILDNPLFGKGLFRDVCSVRHYQTLPHLFAEIMCKRYLNLHFSCLILFYYHKKSTKGTFTSAIFV